MLVDVVLSFVHLRHDAQRHVSYLRQLAIMFAAVWKHSIACHEAETFDFERFINTHIDVVLRGILAEPREERSHA